jgi:signal transduction histidine kinase
MTRFGPKTLLGQTVLVLLAGIGLALGAGAWIYGSARQEAVRAVGALAAAERIINVSRLVGEAPSDWRQRLAQGSSDPLFRVALASGHAPIAADQSDVSALIADYIRQSLPDRNVVARVSEGEVQPGGHRGPGARMGMGGGPGGMGLGHGQMMHGPLARSAMSWRGLEAAIEIADGHWLRFSTSLPDTGPTMSPRLLIALGVSAAIIMLLTAWAVQRVVRPIGVLADAAAQLGRDVASPPLALTGPLEMRRAAEAFNDMQSRLRLLIENRTLMLAAISHDLRTQLTLMRLRVEALEPGEERDRLVRTIAEMEQILTATLSFARDEAKCEARKRVDVGALVTSIADDMSEAGLPVVISDIAQGAVADCKPIALRRAVTNLIDNAVKYGGTATVRVVATAETIDIAIDDEGPGIPSDQLARVTQPFYRVEASRNRETGGIGLGLAIAQSIAQAHGGALRLANRKERGLRATICVPRHDASAQPPADMAVPSKRS